MRRRLIASALLLGALVAAAGAEPRQVGAFNAVEARGRIHVEITTGPAAVEVTGPDSQHVAARVHGDELVISPLDRNWFGPEPEIHAVVHVTAPHLESVQASRGSEVFALDLRSGDLNADASMGGLLRIAGACGRLDASASMGGQIDASGLGCASVHASASMGGTVRATAHDSADASASMGGDISVLGNPGQRSHHSIMGGEVSFD